MSKEANSIGAEVFKAAIGSQEPVVNPGLYLAEEVQRRWKDVTEVDTRTIDQIIIALRRSSHVQQTLLTRTQTIQFQEICSSALSKYNEITQTSDASVNKMYSVFEAVVNQETNF